ncbi:hypothetical protein, partial [Brevibacillus reuszeri]|nr:hypothetical protein [Brevibacillus reuszeri]
RPHGVGLTKSFGRRIVRNSSVLTIALQNPPYGFITINNATDDDSDHYFIKDSIGKPSGSNAGAKDLSGLITVTSDAQAATFEYDENEDRYDVVDNHADTVGHVTLSRNAGEFDLIDGAIINPNANFTSGSTGSIKAKLTNLNGQVVDSVLIDVKRN